MKTITVQDLKSWRDSNKDHQLIDVREDHEVDIVTINGERIRMAEVLSNLDKIRKDCDVVVHCRSGARSGAVVQELDRQGFTNIYNLNGGILAWVEQIDTSLSAY